MMRILILLVSLVFLSSSALAEDCEASANAMAQSLTVDTPTDDINFLPLPRVATRSNVDYLTGGVGLEESVVIKRQSKRFSLRMAFTEGVEAAYVLGVSLKVLNSNGVKVFDIVESGPLLYVDLPIGKYAVLAEYKGVRQSQWVNISKNESSQRVYFNWKQASERAPVPQASEPPRATDADDLSIP